MSSHDDFDDLISQFNLDANKNKPPQNRPPSPSKPSSSPMDTFGANRTNRPPADYGQSDRPSMGSSSPMDTFGANRTNRPPVGYGQSGRPSVGNTSPRDTFGTSRRPMSSPQEEFYSASSRPMPQNRPPASAQESTGSGSSANPPANGGKKKSTMSTARKVGRFANSTLIVVGLVTFAIFLAIFVLQSATDLLGLNKLEGDVEIIIPEGASMGEISKILHNGGVIDQPLTFNIYSRLKNNEDAYLPGTYKMETDWGYDQVMLLLKSKSIEDSIVKLTFVEGMTVLDIATLLEENEVCTAEDFYAAMDSEHFGYSFEDTLPDDKLRFRHLEGYLFPDTYEFFVGENPKSVIKRFLSNFNSKITADMYKSMEAMNMTLDEVITLASIIQKEAGDPVVMKQVSGVFHNRLNSGGAMPMLQSDVTEHYIADNIIPAEADNTAMQDAYNSYKRAGLPVGPVSNPGIYAIKAALYPTDSKDLFFVSDIAHEFYFASTLDGHNANIKKVELINAQIKEEQAKKEDSVDDK